MDEENVDLEQISFQMILHAGNARSSAMQAIEQSHSGDFDASQRSLDEAVEELNIAHDSQTMLITRFAGGDQIGSNILLNHAQDHLTMATLTIDFAKEIVLLRKELGKEKI